MSTDLCGVASQHASQLVHDKLAQSTLGCGLDLWGCKDADVALSLGDWHGHKLRGCSGIAAHAKKLTDVLGVLYKWKKTTKYYYLEANKNRLNSVMTLSNPIKFSLHFFLNTY
jgi:hypothetical protein